MGGCKEEVYARQEASSVIIHYMQIPTPWAAYYYPLCILQPVGMSWEGPRLYEVEIHERKHMIQSK